MTILKQNIHKRVPQNGILRDFLDVALRMSSSKTSIFVVDVLALIFATYMGFALRFSFKLNDVNIFDMAFVGAQFIVTVMLSLIAGRTYKTVWSRASIEEFERFFRYYILGSLLFLLLLRSTREIYFAPRSSTSIIILSGLIFLTLARALWKVAYVCRKEETGEYDNKRIIIVGAGEAGTIVARDLLRYNRNADVIGFVDDNDELKGMFVASKKVIGTTDNLPELIDERKVEVVLIAIPSASGEAIAKIIHKIGQRNVLVRSLPGVLAQEGSEVRLSQFREVSLADLLRRDTIKLDNTKIRKIVEGKSVLVTGAGGSIGSEICKQVLDNNPECLIALGHGENSIYLLIEKLREAGVTAPVHPVIADLADSTTMRLVFEKYKPNVIFHAGAHKHVPLMEFNIREALRVNSNGTYRLAQLAGEFGVERMVMISTDKAVNPTSVMGATKRLAEKLLLFAQSKYPKTKFMVVRFGNVLGSRGSVIPKFEKQIAKGGPVTVTDPEMTRYFMLIPEAVSLVLQAATMGKGGELYVLDMGEPVNITEMAEMLIRLHGKEPYKDVDIIFTGIRPGEKLYEELFYNTSYVDKTGHDKIFRSKLDGKTSGSRELEANVVQWLEDTKEGTMSEDELKKSIFINAR